MDPSLAAINEAVREEVERERRAYGPEPLSAPTAPETIPSAEVLRALSRNEDGDAGLYIWLHRDRFIFDHAAGQWFVWAVHHWEPDTTEQALAGVADVADLYITEMKRQGGNAGVSRR